MSNQFIQLYGESFYNDIYYGDSSVSLLDDILFSGKLFNCNEEEFSSNEVKYQALYVSLTGNIWSDVKYSSNGTYNISLSDEHWLGTDVNIKEDDKVIILFWTPTTENRDSLYLVEWGFIEIANLNQIAYNKNIKICSSGNPNCNFEIPEIAHINDDITLTDKSNDYHSWEFQDNTIEQQYQKYEEILFQINKLPNNSLTINWGDSSEEIVNPGGSYIHNYTESNVYSVQIIIKNSKGLECTLSKNIKVYQDASINFSKEKFKCGYRFIPQIIPALPPVVDYKWTVNTDNGIQLATNDNSILYYNWPFEGIYNIILEIVDTGGFIGTKTISYNIDQCSGGISGYIMEAEPHRFPIVKVKEIDEEKELINISINLITEFDL